MRRVGIMIAVALTAIVLLAFGSCKSPGTDPSSSGVKTDGNATGTEPKTDAVTDTGTEQEEKMIVLAKGKKVTYGIAVGAVEEKDRDMVNSFVKSLNQKTGATFIATATGGIAEQKILIGKADLPENQELYETLPYSGYAIERSGGNIHVCYYESEALKKALNSFLGAVKQSANGSWGIAETYSAYGNLAASSEAIPKSRKGDAALKSVVPCGEGNRMATFEGFTDAAYQEYIKVLATDGFSCYSEHENAGNRFSVYTKGNTQVTLYWYPTRQIFKVIYGTKGYLPATEKGTVASLCTPSITQLGRLAADESAQMVDGVFANGAPGMCYILRLSDGRYIIIDGGPVDKEGKDKKALYDFLMANKPATMEKPVIAAWFITHAHVDHTELAVHFISTYSKQVEVEVVAYNFPDFSSISIKEDVNALLPNAGSFKATVRAYLPQAKTLILHTGQTFWVGDAQIEMLYTQENYTPNTFPTANHTSTAFRILLGGKSILILGDCEQDICNNLAEVYGKNLKSDILQVTHHGVNGGSLALYKLVDPEICFWAIDEWRFQQHPQIRGSSSWDYNKWILDNSIRVRKHYSTSKTTTIQLI